MQNNESSLQYSVAEGPEGLQEILRGHLDKAKQDPLFAQKAHYILYLVGDQKSLIKVDMSHSPFKFWYYDLLGRPATRVIKETISRFIGENGVQEASS